MIGSAIVAIFLTVAPSYSVQIRGVAGDRVPEVNAVVRVFAPDGAAVAGLGPSDFSLFEDGRAVEGLVVRQSHPGEQPLAVSLLVDVSGSMTKDNALQAAIGATKTFLATLTAEDAREILTFGKDITHIARFGEPLDTARLDSLRPFGNTPLRDALSQALDDLAGQATSDKAIVVLTDGKDDGSATSQDAVRSKAQAGGVAVHGIVLGGGDPAPLEDLALATSGSVRTASTPTDLAGVYAAIAAGLRTEYRLGYQTSRTEGRHRLTVVARIGDTAASADRDFVIAGAAPVAVPQADRARSPLVLVAVLVGALVAIAAVVILLRRPRMSVPLTRSPGTESSEPNPVASEHLQLVGAGARFSLVGAGIVVGRDPRSHIVIDDPSVSRTHVRLDVRGRDVWLEDLGSANGTLVNGVRVSQGRLQPGDILGIGDQRLELRGADGG